MARGIRERLAELEIKVAETEFPGNVFYVDADNGNDNYGGTSWDSPWLTIAYALANSNVVDGDKIKIKGSFTLTTGLTIDKEIILEGQNSDSNVYPTMLYTESDISLISIEANNVEIRNIGLVQNYANPAISVGDGSAVYKLVIDGCKFDMYGTGTYGIASPSTEDAPDITIKNCLFRSFATAGILSNWTRAKIANCHFIVGTALSGIIHSPTTGSRPDTQIVNNTFQTTDGTNGVGITVTNTPTVGMLWVDGNHFGQFADDDHCCSKRTGYVGLNWNGITGLSITT